MSNEPDTPSDPPPGPPPEDAPPPQETPPPQDPAPAPSGGDGQKSEKKIVAGILALLLGSLGIHKFYLGYQKEGIIMLVVGIAGWFLCGIPTMVTWVIGIIEGIMYLTKPDEEFDRTYVTGRKPWF